MKIQHFAVFRDSYEIGNSRNPLRSLDLVTRIPIIQGAFAQFCQNLGQIGNFGSKFAFLTKTANFDRKFKI